MNFQLCFHSHSLCYIASCNIWQRQIDDLEGAKRAGDLFDYPLMMKSKRLAYDGRGNAVAKSEDDLSSAVIGNILINNSYNSQQNTF